LTSSLNHNLKNNLSLSTQEQSTQHKHSSYHANNQLNFAVQSIAKIQNGYVLILILILNTLLNCLIPHHAASSSSSSDPQNEKDQPGHSQSLSKFLSELSGAYNSNDGVSRPNNSRILPIANINTESDRQVPTEHSQRPLYREED
jgi:hypothetical protein